MIIVPNHHAKQHLTDYPNRPILLLSQYQAMLMEETDYMVATDTLIRYYFYQHKLDHLDALPTHINFILEEEIHSDDDDQNFQWVQGITRSLCQFLQQHQLIHPKAVSSFLAKHTQNPLYQGIAHYGFENLSSSLKSFFQALNIQPMKRKPLSPALHLYQYSHKTAEIKHAISQTQGENAAIITLDKTYNPLLTLYQTNHPNHLLQLLSLPDPKIPCANLSYLQQHHLPKGLSLFRSISRSKYTPMISPGYLSIHYPIQSSKDPINYETFFNIIQSIAMDWRLPLPATLFRLKIVSLVQETLPFLTWHTLCFSTQSTYLTSPQDLLGAQLETLWVLGATEHHWQQQITLKWIPASYQKQLDFSYLTQMATNLYLSATLQDEHGHTQQFLQTQPIEYPDHTPVIEKEYFQDDHTQPLDTIHPSTRLLQDYATCPFKAFAYHRLTLEPKSNLQHDIERKDFGILSHDILEQLYQNITTQADLEDIQDQQIETALTHAFEKHRLRLHPDLIPIIKSTLHTYIKQWIEKDRSRDDFIVTHLETKRQLHLGEFTLNLRIDRIDHAQDQAILIDYKTAHVHIKESLEPNLSNPQMILYALTEPNSCQIAYAKPLRKPIWQSIDLSSLEDYETLREHWKQTLISHLHHFQQGQYPVKPFSPQACQQCQLQALCRIGEQHAH